jgi:hypothetical protein
MPSEAYWFHRYHQARCMPSRPQRSPLRGDVPSRFGDQRRVGSYRNNHRHMASNEISRKRREPPRIALSVAGLNGHVASHDLPGLRQALGEHLKWAQSRRSRHASEPPDHRHRRLLPAHHPRPRRHAPQPRELPTPHPSCLRAAVRAQVTAAWVHGHGLHLARGTLPRPFLQRDHLIGRSQHRFGGCRPSVRAAACRSATVD